MIEIGDAQHMALLCSKKREIQTGRSIYRIDDTNRGAVYIILYILSAATEQLNSWKICCNRAIVEKKSVWRFSFALHHVYNYINETTSCS